MGHVDESETNATLGFEILGQIEVVILSLELLVYHLHHFCLRKLYRYVADHQSCQFLNLKVVAFSAIEDSLEVNLVVLGADQNLLGLVFALRTDERLVLEILRLRVKIVFFYLHRLQTRALLLENLANVWSLVS